MTHRALVLLGVMIELGCSRPSSPRRSAHTPQGPPNRAVSPSEGVDAGAREFRLPLRTTSTNQGLCGCDTSGSGLCIVEADSPESARRETAFGGTRCLLMAQGDGAECIVPPHGNATCRRSSADRFPVEVRMASLGADALSSDEIRVSASYLYYVSPVGRFYAHARLALSDDSQPPAVDFEGVIRLSESPLRLAANPWLICFLFPGGRIACWNHERPIPRRQPLVLDSTEVGTSLALGRNLVAVGASSGSVFVFGRPVGEGALDPSSWRRSPVVRLTGAQGPIGDVAIVNYTAHAIAGDSLYWWHYRIDNDEPRVRRPEGVCALGASGLRFSTSYESSSVVCVQDAVGRYACNADPFQLCDLARTRFR